MKKASRIAWGIVLIIAGVLFALNAFDITNIEFDGWWTLFIIVPCAIGLFTEREKMGNIIGILIGVALLLACREIISFSLIWKLIGPAIIVAVGIKLIFGGLFDRKLNEAIAKLKKNRDGARQCNAIFSGSDLKVEGERFEGATLNAIFGGIKCDLRSAKLESDCVIDVSAVFGGIDILLPENAKVKINTTSVFGGTEDKSKPAQDANVTVYVSGFCLFGGVDVK